MSKIALSPSKSFLIVTVSASVVSVFIMASACLKKRKQMGRWGEDVEVYVLGTERNRNILSASQDLLTEPWGLGNRHFASALAQLRPSPFWGRWGRMVTRRTERLTTPAGCDIEIEIVEPANLSDSTTNSSIPTIIVLYGVVGRSTEPYVEQAALHIAVKKRWRAIVLNYAKVRILPGAESSSLGGYNLVDGGDLNFLISHLRKTFDGFLGAVGYSMGGSKLVQYLIRTQEHCNLDAACTISAPLDYTTKNETVYKPYISLTSRFYHFVISSAIKLWMLRNYNELKKHPKISASKPFQRTASGMLWWIRTTTVPEVDIAVTIHGRGYSDIDQYYSDGSATDRLRDGIATPYLCLTAKNDPLVPQDIIPSKDVALANENIFIVNTTRVGGHIGFWLPGLGCWATLGCLSFFDAVRRYAPHEPQPKLVRQSRSLRAAYNLQRQSSTGLTNYFKLLAPDSCVELANDPNVHNGSKGNAPSPLMKGGPVGYSNEWAMAEPKAESFEIIEDKTCKI